MTSPALGSRLRDLAGRLRHLRSPEPPPERGGDPQGELVVAFANTQFGAPLGLARRSGPPGVRFTSDPDDVATADAVVFHLPTLGRLPRRKPAGQVWVAWCMESAVNYPQLADPRFMCRFDLIMTYRMDSDVPLPYTDTFGGQLVPLLLAPRGVEPKPELATSFISSPVDHSRRLWWQEQLSQQLPLHCYGRIGRNRSLPRDDGRSTKLEVLGRYRFTLAFENSIAHDYVTEKFYDPLTSGSIPVYLGAPNVEDFAPGDRCYIDVSAFRTPGELAGFLRQVAADEAAWRSYQQWRKRPLRPAFLRLAELQQDPLSRLGERLLRMTDCGPATARGR